jgi:hypothetical protein
MDRFQHCGHGQMEQLGVFSVLSSPHLVDILFLPHSTVHELTSNHIVLGNDGRPQRTATAGRLAIAHGGLPQNHAHPGLEVRPPLHPAGFAYRHG